MEERCYVAAPIAGLSQPGLRGRRLHRTISTRSTVISEIGAEDIGSNPAITQPDPPDRGPARDSWVFSWAQCRLMLPGWFGRNGRGDLDQAASGQGHRTVAGALSRRWPFFRTLLSNMDMVLSKSSIAIASALCGARHRHKAARHHLPAHPCRVADLDPAAAADHGAGTACCKAIRCWTFDPQSFFLSRSAGTTLRWSC